MKSKRLFVALLGFPGLALAVAMDSNPTDETYIRLQFERNMEQSREIMRIRDAKRKEFLERSHLGGAGDSCLAYAAETGDCSISAAEFDRSLASHFPDSLEFQSGESLALKAREARRSVFDQLVDRAFLYAHRREDSVRAPGSKVRKTRPEGGGAFEENDLPILLRAFPHIRAQVFAASDSAWLAARLENPRGGILPVTMPAWELPDSVAALLARLPRGEWTPIRRVPFGFLACGWLDTLPAREMLAQLRSRLDHYRSQAGADERSRAIESLRQQGDGCLQEDTLGLSLRLAPALRRQAQEPGPAWLNAHSAALPASVKSALWKKSKHGALDTLGPIRGVYGTWMLALSSPEIKPGRTLDSAACLARALAKAGKEADVERIRSEWDILASRMGADQSAEARTALLERLSRQGSQPESEYQRMRERWASRSLRFTRDLGFLDAAPETAKGGND
jgi:hypothetical protein